MADPLALAVTQLPGWRWLPGMRDTAGRIVLRVRGGRPVVRSALGEPDGLSEWTDALPDLDDPATAGCLLAMLGPTVSVCGDPETPLEAWVVAAWPQGVGGPCVEGAAPTLGRACAEALCAIGRCA